MNEWSDYKIWLKGWEMYECLWYIHNSIKRVRLWCHLLGASCRPFCVGNLEFVWSCVPVWIWVALRPWLLWPSTRSAPSPTTWWIVRKCPTNGLMELYFLLMSYFTGLGAHGCAHGDSRTPLVILDLLHESLVLPLHDVNVPLAIILQHLH